MPRIEKKIALGKIAYAGKRRVNLVELEIALDECEAGPIFSANATVWNQSKTDCVLGGQCLDCLVPYLKGDGTFDKVYRLWKAHHLNDMHAGTPKQEAAVEEYLKDHDYDYREVCDYLEFVGLLEDDEYKYGSSWLYKAIPEDDLKEIKKLF